MILEFVKEHWPETVLAMAFATICSILLTPLMVNPPTPEERAYIQGRMDARMHKAYAKGYVEVWRE